MDTLLIAASDLHFDYEPEATRCPRGECEGSMEAAFPGKTYAEFAQMISPAVWHQCSDCQLWADRFGNCYWEMMEELLEQYSDYEDRDLLVGLPSRA